MKKQVGGKIDSDLAKKWDKFCDASGFNKELCLEAAINKFMRGFKPNKVKKKSSEKTQEILDKEKKVGKIVAWQKT